MLSAQDIVAALELAPHPEGGWYRETFRDERMFNGRAASTAIYYLLAHGQRSARHRIDAAEIWHVYGGAPLLLSLERDGEKVSHRLGSDIAAGEAPQIVVPEKVWQSAQTLGDWTLVGCTVAPGFEVRALELARKS